MKKFILYEVKILKYFQKKLYWYSQDLLDKCHLRCPQLGQRYQEVQSNHPQEFQLKIKLLSGTRAGTFWSYLHIYSLQETWEIAVKVISFCNVIYLIIYIVNVILVWDSSSIRADSTTPAFHYGVKVLSNLSHYVFIFSWFDDRYFLFLASFIK